MVEHDAALQAAAEQIGRAQAEKALRPSIAGFFDEATNTVSYVVHDPSTCEAAIIDLGSERATSVGKEASKFANFTPPRFLISRYCPFELNCCSETEKPRGTV